MTPRSSARGLEMLPSKTTCWIGVVIVSISLGTGGTGPLAWARIPGLQQTTEPRRNDATAATPAPGGKRAQIEALQPIAGLVGQWRGVGQPTRGSNKGAWSETAQWQWELTDTDASLKLEIAEGKQLTEGRLKWLIADQVFEFSAQLPDGSKQVFRGTRAENKLTLDAVRADTGALLQRVVVTHLNENRALLLFQSKGPRQSTHQRIAEVGYTRAGTRLAREGADHPVCVVTGGRGTIEVQFEGQTYWVCCTGCEDAFRDDPKGIIAAFKERQKTESTSKPR